MKSKDEIISSLMAKGASKEQAERVYSTMNREYNSSRNRSRPNEFTVNDRMVGPSRKRKAKRTRRKARRKKNEHIGIPA
jgi:hypothetical protein